VRVSSRRRARVRSWPAHDLHSHSLRSLGTESRRDRGRSAKPRRRIRRRLADGYNRRESPIERRRAHRSEQSDGRGDRSPIHRDGRSRGPDKAGLGRARVTLRVSLLSRTQVLFGHSHFRHFVTDANGPGEAPRPRARRRGARGRGAPSPPAPRTSMGGDSDALLQAERRTDKPRRGAARDHRPAIGADLPAVREARARRRPDEPGLESTKGALRPRNPFACYHAAKRVIGKALASTATSRRSRRVDGK